MLLYSPKLERPRVSLKDRTTATVKQDYGVRVNIPTAMPMDFVHRPAPKFELENRSSSKIDPGSVKGRLGKKMVIIARPTRKNTRAVAMSVEGRGT